MTTLEEEVAQFQSNEQEIRLCVASIEESFSVAAAAAANIGCGNNGDKYMS